MMRRTLLLVPLLAAGLVAAGCDFGGTLPAGQARLTILLTDAPGDLENVWIRVDEIHLQGQGGQTTLRDEPTGWIHLSELTDGRTAELVEGLVVPSGRYVQLRFIVTRVVLEEEGGRVFASAAVDAGDLPAAGLEEPSGSVVCPSCPQTGIKVAFPGGSLEVEGEANVVVLDFDVAESFGRQAGASEQWVMHPLVRATEIGLSGGISGTVVLDPEDLDLGVCGPADTEIGIGHFKPQAFQDGEVVSTGTTGDDGAFSIPFLPAGEYEMGEAELELDGFTLTFEASADPAVATVQAGGTTTVNYTVTGASCAADGS